MYSNQATLDDVEFLVRSSNRLAVLDAIRTAPRPRHELREIADASRVTLSRILGDLEDRGWIERTGRRYAPTPEGAVVATEVTRLFANLDATGMLGETLRWLPVERFDFELARLGDAEVIRPTDRDLTATVTRVTRRVRGASRVRNVATGISSEVVDAYLDAAASDGRTLETVLHARVFDVVEDDPGLRGQLQAMLEADAITVRRYDGDETPTMVTICDDVVLFCGQSGPGSRPEAVETTDERVRAWANSRFEAIRSASEPVEIGAFTP